MSISFSSYFRLLLLVLLLAAAGMAGPAAAEPVANSSGSSAKHAVAITFDDGPSPRYTPQILALLKQYQAKATFFVLGCKVEKYPAVIKEASQMVMSWAITPTATPVCENGPDGLAAGIGAHRVGLGASGLPDGRKNYAPAL